ncbi:hypothetical protein [Streptomyces aureoversilis]|uniref:Uncharacterized protein n=1 Tax=Streptomyces aureoversilis TaxID=67277 RepID=A0ABW0AB87_9ACTN
MARHRCHGPGCGLLLPDAGPAGGRPRLFCSERCRSRHRRLMQRIDRGRERREDRLQATAEERHRLRAAAFTVAREARRLAAALDAEAAEPDWRQPAGWGRPHPAGRLGAPYTRSALQLLEAAHVAVAAAVAADRAAGNGWAEIGAALGVSEDTAARRYRTPEY